MRNYQQGFYKPKNPEKYKGDVNKIVYRSSWELKVLKYLDESPNIIWFSSEELKILYKSPIDNRIHRYFPDFVIRVSQKNGTEKTLVLEIKPLSQTKMPKQRRKTKQFIAESATYAVNQEKWRAADIFCKEHGWEFKIITEKELGI